MKMTQRQTSNRIRKGRAWLLVNSEDYCQRHSKDYNHKKYVQSLHTYETLVDDFDGEEVSAWDYTQTHLEEMEAYEVEYWIMSWIDTTLPEVIDKRLER